MVSPNVVRKRLGLLEGYLKKLRRIHAKFDLEKFLADSDTQDIVDRNLHLAIESIFDIGQHIIASSGWKPVEEYAGIFTTLLKNKVISKKIYSRVQGMAGFRNLLVHEYAELDHAQVFDVLKNHLKDLEELAQVYEKFVDSEAAKQ